MLYWLVPAYRTFEENGYQNIYLVLFFVRNEIYLYLQQVRGKADLMKHYKTRESALLLIKEKESYGGKDKREQQYGCKEAK